MAFMFLKFLYKYFWWFTFFQVVIDLLYPFHISYNIKQNDIIYSSLSIRNLFLIYKLKYSQVRSCLIRLIAKIINIKIL